MIPAGFEHPVDMPEELYAEAYIIGTLLLVI